MAGIREPGEGPAAPDNTRQSSRSRLPLCQGVKTISPAPAVVWTVFKIKNEQEQAAIPSCLNKDQLIEIKGKPLGYRWGVLDSEQSNKLATTPEKCSYALCSISLEASVFSHAV